MTTVLKHIQSTVALSIAHCGHSTITGKGFDDTLSRLSLGSTYEET